ncbi:MAG TPA: DoxX family protein [Candidatus Methylomirabilis sp.]|nr:DoxX family protein [Candidatus Methylomirabilis sp.]
MRILNSLQPVALLLLRVVFGVIFMSHGYPLLAHHTGATQTLYVLHGLPGYFASVVGVVDLFGGGLLLIGLFTRGASLVLAIETVYLILKVYTPHSYFALNEYGFPLVVAVGCFALATLGAGALSVDWPLFESGGRARGRATGK